MSKTIIFTGIFGGIVLLFIAFNAMKESYKMLPINPDISFEETHDDWRNFTAPEGRFTVKLPVLPQNAKDRVNDPKTGESLGYDMYISELSDGTVYMISLIEFPSTNITPNKDLMNKIMNDMVGANPKNQLRDIRRDPFHETESLDFEITNDELQMRTKAFMEQKTLYVLTMITKHDNFNVKNFDFFVNSFEVKP